MRIQQVLDNDLCSGCGGCYFIAPSKLSMHEDADGALRPQVQSPLSAAESDLFEKICPGSRVEHTTGGDTDELWGPVVQTYAGWSKNDIERWRGSSGAAITAIASWALASGFSDGVLHTGRTASDPLRAGTVLSRTPEEVREHSGSRYQPSSVLDGLRAALDSCERIVVIGRPCDIAALRSLMRMDNQVATQVVLTISFFCGGTPKQTGTQQVLDHLGVAGTDVENFRFRGEGWPGLTTAITADGQERSLDYNTAWGRVLNQHLLWRCKLCADATGEFADIVAADAWHGDESGYPTFDEQPGRSLILVRTPLGSRTINEAMSSSALECEPLNRAEIAAMQPFHVKRRNEMLARLAGASLAGSRVPRYRRMRLIRQRRHLSLWGQISATVGTFRRARAKRVGRR